MFELERLKLAEYKVQNIELSKQKVVSVSDLNTITYRKNKYSLPVGMYKQADRLRVEDDGEFVTITDPITNEVVARHKLADGIGHIVKVAPPKKPQYPIVASFKKLFEDNAEAIKYVDKICEEKPRYIIEQCRLLKKIYKKYGLQESVSVIIECSDKNIFDATEVLTMLVKRHGIEQAAEVVPKRTKTHYGNKAKGLSKYDELARRG